MRQHPWSSRFACSCRPAAGSQKSEVLTLRWEHVPLDVAELWLSETKIGARLISLPPMAVTLLADLACDLCSPCVIPNRNPGTHLCELAGAWSVIPTRADLGDVRIHDLRHSFASRALAFGKLADDRQAVGSQPSGNHRAVRPSHTRVGAGVSRANSRKHRVRPIGHRIPTVYSGASLPSSQLRCQFPFPSASISEVEDNAFADGGGSIWKI